MQWPFAARATDLGTPVPRLWWTGTQRQAPAPRLMACSGPMPRTGGGRVPCADRVVPCRGEHGTGPRPHCLCRGPVLAGLPSEDPGMQQSFAAFTAGPATGSILARRGPPSPLPRAWVHRSRDFGGSWHAAALQRRCHGLGWILACSGPPSSLGPRYWVDRSTWVHRSRGLGRSCTPRPSIAFAADLGHWSRHFGGSWHAAARRRLCLGLGGTGPAT